MKRRRFGGKIPTGYSRKGGGGGGEERSLVLEKIRKVSILQGSLREKQVWGKNTEKSSKLWPLWQ